MIREIGNAQFSYWVIVVQDDCGELKVFHRYGVSEEHVRLQINPYAYPRVILISKEW